MTVLAKLSLVAAALVVAGCETPRRVDVSEPTVTYRYEAGESDLAMRNAAEYCADRYDSRASLRSRRVDGDTYTATFECVR